MAIKFALNTQTLFQSLYFLFNQGKLRNFLIPFCHFYLNELPPPLDLSLLAQDRVFADYARGWQCPFVVCLHPQGCLRRGVRARETGPILRCAGKAGNPFQTTQGNLLTCRDQEGRRGSEEAVPGPSVFPSGDYAEKLEPSYIAGGSVK